MLFLSSIPNSPKKPKKMPMFEQFLVNSELREYSVHFLRGPWLGLGKAMVPAFSVFPEYSTYFMFAQNSKLEVDRTFSMSSLPGVKKTARNSGHFCVVFLFFFCLLDIELCITRIEYGCWFYIGLKYIPTEHSFCFVNRHFYNIF